MIKKYFAQRNSVFVTTIMLSLYEPGSYGFSFENLSDDERRRMFSQKHLIVNEKNKNISFKDTSTTIEIIYLNEKNILKALVLYSPETKKHYFFRLEDSKPFVLITQTNYISTNLDEIIKEYEKRRSKKEGLNSSCDFNIIKDINYFESYFNNSITKRINKDSDIVRITFDRNNKFTSDFARLIEQKKVVIEDLGMIKTNIFDRDNMAKPYLLSNRRDCLLVDFSTGDIKFIIFTSRFKYSLINHYFLLKKIGNNAFTFIYEDVCFEKVFLQIDKDITFKDLKADVSQVLSETKYEEFYLKCLEFEGFEEIDESLENEIKIIETFEQESSTQESSKLPQELELYFQDYGFQVLDKLIYFLEFEDFPLAYLGDGFIKIKQNRLLNDTSLTNQISLKDINKIKNKFEELFKQTLPSRVLYFEKIINRLIKVIFNEENFHQKELISEIEACYSSLRQSDKKYFKNKINSLYELFKSWRSVKPEETIEKEIIEEISEEPIEEESEIIIDSDVYVTNHGSFRLMERVGISDKEEQLKLSVDAYHKGLNSAHFIEKDLEMFKCLNYLQNKYLGRTLRLFKDFVFIFSIEPPHGLITVYGIEKSQELYMKNNKNLLKQNYRYLSKK